MNARSVVLSALFALTPALPLYAQDRESVRERWEPADETPVVRLWTDDRRSIYRMGEVVRLRFQVEEDAYVAVVRVDGNGRLSLLWPRNPRARALARAGKTNDVNSHRGYSFNAGQEQGTGYVFAIASYDPLDLSLLSRYDGWTYRASYGRPYYGSPERIVNRIASQVMYDGNSPWDYDVFLYNVDAPTATNWNGWNAQCSSLSDLRYGTLGSGFSDYCNPAFARNRYLMYSGYCSVFSVLYGGFCAYDPYTWINRPPTPPSNPGPVAGIKRAIIQGATGRPFVDEGATDTDADGVQRTEARRQDDHRIATGDGVTWAPNEQDRVYSIPQRVIERMREQDAQRRGSIAAQAVGARDGLGNRDGSDRTQRAPMRGADASVPRAPAQDRTDIGRREPPRREFDGPSREAPMREAPRRSMDSPAMIDRRAGDDGRNSPRADSPRADNPRTDTHRENPRMEAAREAPRYTPPAQVTPAQVSPPQVTPVQPAESGSKGESGEKKP